MDPVQCSVCPARRRSLPSRVHTIAHRSAVPLRGLPALTYGLVSRAAHILDRTANVWDTLNVPLSRLRTLDAAAFDQQKTSLLSAHDRAVRSFVASNDFAADVRRETQYHARNPFEAGRCQIITDQMSRAANLL